MQTTTLAAPKTERIQLIDSLRGFALFGILIAHITYWFTAGALPGEVYQKFEGLGFQIAGAFEGILVSGKFYTFFSFLFGVSFALQMSSKDFTIGRFLWRLALLGVIGLIHSAHWRGDILSIYTVVGLVLVLFRNSSDKVLVAVAFLMILNLPIRIKGLLDTLNPAPPPSAQQQKADEQKNKEFYQMLKSGSYTDILKASVPAFAEKFHFQFDSGRIYITLGYFLLGFLAGRRRWFQAFEQHKPFFKKWLKISGFSTLGIIAIALAIGMLFGNSSEPMPWLNYFMNALYDVHCMMLTFFYIAGMAFLLQKSKWQGVARALSYVGRMALTSYLGQTFIGIILFYGIGFGLVGEINPGYCLLMTFPVFALQVVMSRWWLSKFNYGPIEWLWRSGTQLRWQPLKRHEESNLAT
ncbi:MAG: DUF418 domain-containing protein [Spirosomataceae bacterium]